RVWRDRKCIVSVEISPISHTVPELLLLPVYRPTLLFPVVGRHRTMSGPVPESRLWSKILVLPLRFRFYLIPFLSYNYFRFTGRHCYFRLSTGCRPTSCNVGDSSSVLGLVESKM